MPAKPLDTVKMVDQWGFAHMVDRHAAPTPDGPHVLRLQNGMGVRVANDGGYETADGRIKLKDVPPASE